MVQINFADRITIDSLRNYSWGWRQWTTFRSCWANMSHHVTPRCISLSKWHFYAILCGHVIGHVDDSLFRKCRCEIVFLSKELAWAMVFNIDVKYRGDAKQNVCCSAASSNPSLDRTVQAAMVEGRSVCQSADRKIVRASAEDLFHTIIRFFF